MLHELLLALVGFTGDVFIDVEEQDRLLGLTRRSNKSNGSADEDQFRDSCTFRLASDLEFLQPSDREILERLLKLGFHYRELDRFSVKSRNLSWIRSLPLDNNAKTSAKSAAHRHSVYQRAMANAITEFLAVYRSAVLKVEQNILTDPVPVLGIVTRGLNQFELLLPPLHALVREVEQKKLRGGRLLSFLHEKCHCGVSELQSCIQRLLWHCHQVTYRQLSAWMVYGLLHDENDEFFIRRNIEEEQQPTAEVSNYVENAKTSRASEDAHMIDWHTGFCVRMEMLPEYISLQVAESILFVGKAVRVLRNPSASFKSQISSQAHGKPLSNGFSSSSFAKAYSCSGSYEGPELLPQEEGEKIASLLCELKDKPLFHKLSFERAVDSVRAIAATHLWKLVVVHADLVGHLKAFKDYFLLAKGDFFQCFLEESRLLMKLPPRPSSAEADLKVPFQQAAVKTVGDDDKYFSRVYLRMAQLTAAAATPSQAEIKQRSSIEGYAEMASYDGWDGITLEYSIDWPLQLLFTREVLAKYNKVFQYLLRLKRIQLELEKSWAKAMQQDRDESTTCRRKKTIINHFQSSSRHQRMPIWRLRQHMAYLITNLQFYIQVDVIESQWNLLQERVEASKDFTELSRFHQEYLSALISQSFLDIGSVSRILDSIIKLCLQLCRIIEHHDACSHPTDLEQITEEFNKKSNSLYTILRSSKLAGSQRAPFLRQFLLRLNYNSFFESTARGALNVVRPRLTSVN